MAPGILPASAGQSSYTITDSRGLVADFTLDLPAEPEPRYVNLIRPDGTPGLVARLKHVPTGISVPLHLVTGSDTSVPDREVIVSRSATEINCNIRDVSGLGAVDERWTLTVSSTAPQDWALGLELPGVFVTQLVCDPVVRQAPFAATAPEKTQLQLVAADAAQNTVVRATGVPGLPPAPPSLTYTWNHTGTIAINDLPAHQQISTVLLPGVYGDVSTSVTLRVDTDVSGTVLSGTSPAAPLTIKPRPQQLVLVLDRSGSMQEELRWENATAAAKLLTHLFIGMREGVHGDDRVGIVVFEDEKCFRHGPPPSARIQSVLPLSKLVDADAQICGLGLGQPGACTPIGDGLMKGMDVLADEGPHPDAKFTVVLMTDGYANAGVVETGPDPLGPGQIPLAVARSQGRRAAVDNRMSLFLVGLGSTANLALLNHLKATTSVAGDFLTTVDPSQLAGLFGHVLGAAQEANPLQTGTQPPSGVADPGAPPATANAVYFATSGSAERLVFAVLVNTGQIEVAIRPFGSGAFTVQGFNPRICPDHRAVLLPHVQGLGVQGPIEWRVIHRAGTPPAPRPLPATDVLAYEDLHVKADLVLDKPVYRTGDPMKLTVRIRHDSAPVRGARVRAVLEAPEAAYGEELATFAPRYEKAEPTGEDPPDPRTAMVRALMRANGWKRWPYASPPAGIFQDGTDELHDVDGDGNYTNVFNRAFLDGAYTWTLFVDGEDQDGGHFDRRLMTSTFVAFKVDPKVTGVDVLKAAAHPSGLAAARVLITPRDARKRRLGPFHDHAVLFELRNGSFEHIVDKKPPPHREDGVYERVVLYKKGQRPVVRVSVDGTLLRPVDVEALLRSDD
ncbi:hypothetical protein [Streptomyces sp. NPDC059010]|uniref:vWA domain-containing protein n=1 Tax=Streptomyces sp. NPDC059010 TaxID=3346695 RepID=UPI0036BA3572